MRTVTKMEAALVELHAKRAKANEDLAAASARALEVRNTAIRENPGNLDRGATSPVYQAEKRVTELDRQVASLSQEIAAREALLEIERHKELEERHATEAKVALAALRHAKSEIESTFDEIHSKWAAYVEAAEQVDRTPGANLEEAVYADLMPWLVSKFAGVARAEISRINAIHDTAKVPAGMGAAHAGFGKAWSS